MNAFAWVESIAKSSSSSSCGAGSEGSPGFQPGNTCAGGSQSDQQSSPTSETDGGSEQQVDQTKTPEFKKWFGDSKVVDENGEPLVVYHGTQSNFTEFETDRDFDGQTVDPNAFLGSHFAVDPDVAGRFATELYGADERDGGRTLPVFLSIKNPLQHGDGTPDPKVVSKFESEIEYLESKYQNAKPKPTSEQLLAALQAEESGDSGAVDRVLNSDESRKIESEISSKRSELRRYKEANRPFTESEIYEAAGMTYDQAVRLRHGLEGDELVEVSKEIGQRIKTSLIDQGYDGIFYENSYRGTEVGWTDSPATFIAFDPEQVKSAIGNDGSFDPSNADITKSKTKSFWAAIFDQCGAGSPGGKGFRKGNTCSKKKVTLSVRRTADKQAATDYLGLPMADDIDLARLAGFVEDSKLSIEYRKNRIVLISENDDYRAVRYVDRHDWDGGSYTFIRNVEFEVKGDKQGNGIATRLIESQVEQASKYNINRIGAIADDGGGNVGYYVWPRLGFDAEIPWARVQMDFANKLPEWTATKPRLSDVMADRKSRDWWKKHGRAMVVFFDLNEGSNSRRILREYTEGRKKKSWDSWTVSRFKSKSGCGAGDEGNPGFQEGNDCASGGKKVGGFIDESHADEVAEVFGEEMGEALANAEGGTFLDLVRKNMESNSLAGQVINDGGFTYNPTNGTSPKSGFAIAMFPEKEEILDIEEITPAKIFKYIQNNPIATQDERVHIGAWYNKKTDDNPNGDNKVYLDVSMVIDDRDEAIKLAREHGQLGIFDLKNFVTIETMTPDERKEWENAQKQKGYPSRSHSSQARFNPRRTEAGSNRPVSTDNWQGANPGTVGRAGQKLKKSTCGAGATGSPGFQPGNTCATGSHSWKETLLDVPLSEMVDTDDENAVDAALGIKKIQERHKGVAVLNVADLSSDPQRFQYKVEGVGKGGVTDQFKDVQFNPELSGILYVWHDLEDGQTYVVNGHHRYELAKASGYDGPVAVRYIDRDDWRDARAFGALINIAEGQGTALDAAKFGRDMELRGEELINYFAKHNISLTGKVAKDAVTLSNLSDNIFRELTFGRLPEKHARAIGSELKISSGMPDSEREAIWEVQNKIAQRIAGKSKYSEAMVREMAVIASSAPKIETESMSLFGSDSQMEVLFEDRAAIQAYVRGELAKQARGFGAVASDKREDLLRESGVGDVNSQEAAKLEEKTRQSLQLFDQEIRLRGSLGGKLNEILNDAAEQYGSASGAQKRKIKKEAADRVVSALSVGPVDQVREAANSAKSKYIRLHDEYESLPEPANWDRRREDQDVKDWIRKSNDIMNEMSATRKEWRKAEKQLDEIDPGWRSRGFLPNKNVKIKPYKRYGKGAWEIHLNDKKIGHLVGVTQHLTLNPNDPKEKRISVRDVLSTTNTKIEGVENRGKRAYQTALARAAVYHEGGTVSARFQMSTMIQRAIQKIPGIQWLEQRESWYLSPVAAKAFLEMDDES